VQDHQTPPREVRQLAQLLPMREEGGTLSIGDFWFDGIEPFVTGVEPVDPIIEGDQLDELIGLNDD
jgi:hypothetical protein